MSSLREELGGQPDPEFEMDLPPGWSRRPVAEDTSEHLLAALKQRLMQAHKPQAYAELKVLIEEGFKEMRRNGAFAYFSATDPEPGTLWIPASIVASVRSAEAGKNLDDLARTLIRSHGATPLLGDKRTLRFESERSLRLEGKTLTNHSITYLTPIPGTGRRRALQLVAGFATEPGTPANDPLLGSLRMLLDGCVSTVRWHRPRPDVTGERTARSAREN